jgi:membrane-associated phospholipid phosphatase
MTTAGATLLTLELLGRSRWAIAVAWIGGVGISSATAALRVAAGRHFTSDVITGALIGMGVGAAVPLAHVRPRRHDRGPRRWSLMPSGGRSYSGASLVIALP